MTKLSEVQELRKSLESISEYWNRNENDKAMENACNHNIEMAESAIPLLDSLEKKLLAGEKCVEALKIAQKVIVSIGSLTLQQAKNRLTENETPDIFVKCCSVEKEIDEAIQLYQEAGGE